jgi:hypothetical protein
MEYKLDKHSGSPVEWTKYWMVTRFLMEGNAKGAAFAHIFSKGTLSWVSDSVARSFNQFVGSLDPSSRQLFFEFMLRQGDAEVIRLLRIGSIASGLAAINPDHYQRVFSPFWPRVKGETEDQAENAILTQVNGGNLAAAGTLIQNGDTIKLQQFLLYQRQSGDVSLYSRILFAIPPGLVMLVGDSIAPDLRQGVYDWIDNPAQAVYVINRLQALPPTAMIEAIKNVELRARLAEHGGEAWTNLVAATPILRIGAAVEGHMDTTNPDIDLDALAQAAFEAFLGDLPLNQLHYCTNSVDFKPIDGLLGKPGSKGAPCMMLSSVFAHILGQWPHAVNMVQAGDDRPLLTKPLASISDTGTLTRDTAFKGNVVHYDGADGFADINRVFFGDGHIWLEFNGRQYDPTLGISGGPGTVQAAVEQFYVAGVEDDTFRHGNLVVTKHDEPLPPGGAPLRFTRSIRIERRLG